MISKIGSKNNLIRFNIERDIIVFEQVTIPCSKSFSNIDIKLVNDYLADKLGDYPNSKKGYLEYINKDGQITRMFGILLGLIEESKLKRLKDYNIYRAFTDSDLTAFNTNEFLGIVTLQALDLLKSNQVVNLGQGVDSSLIEIINCLISMADDLFTSMYKPKIKGDSTFEKSNSFDTTPDVVSFDEVKIADEKGKKALDAYKRVLAIDPSDINKNRTCIIGKETSKSVTNTVTVKKSNKTRDKYFIYTENLSQLKLSLNDVMDSYNTIEDIIDIKITVGTRDPQILNYVKE